MKLFSRRRWGLVSAQQVNYFLIKWHNNTFILLGTITQFVSQLGRYKPSSPSTKQHHALTDSHRRILGKNIEVYESSEAHTSTHSLSLSLSHTHTHPSTHGHQKALILSLLHKWGPVQTYTLSHSNGDPSVWPEKNRQKSLKLAQKWFH